MGGRDLGGADCTCGDAFHKQVKGLPVLSVWGVIPHGKGESRDVPVGTGREAAEIWDHTIIDT